MIGDMSELKFRQEYVHAIWHKGPLSKQLHSDLAQRALKQKHLHLNYVQWAQRAIKQTIL